MNHLPKRQNCISVALLKKNKINFLLSRWDFKKKEKKKGSISQQNKHIRQKNEYMEYTKKEKKVNVISVKLSLACSESLKIFIVQWALSEDTEEKTWEAGLESKEKREMTGAVVDYTVLVFFF